MERLLEQSSVGLGPASASEARPRDLPALTGMRFFLALWVILHHLTGPGQDLEAVALYLPHPIFTLIRGGYQAVTTFFVLSGFVLTRTYAATHWNRRNLFNYATGRIARIYPVYLFSLAVMIPFILEDRTPAKGLYCAAYATLTQAWLGPLPVNWNTPAWSLSCEMFFYAVFPLCFALIRRTNWRNVIAVGVGACILTRLMWAAGISDGIKPLVHLADFIMGVAAACAFDLLLRRKRSPAAWKFYVPGIAGVALLLAFPGILPGFLDLNTVLRPLNALLLIGLALGFPALSGRLLVYLGKSSYAMYILHVPIMWWYLRKSHTFSPVLYVAIVIAVSAVVYGLFEEPANRAIRRVLRRPAKS
jgi:peptidoglycan/LPS O-acetylase OafA/YrhL